LGPALLVFLLYFVALSQARTISEDSSSALIFIAVHALFLLSGLFLLFKEELSQWLRGRA
jgi:lipopolysaccharide export system permease protein